MTDSPQRIYLDNAATSWPKPDSVYDAVDQYQRHNGSPFGRGSHASGSEVYRIVNRCRQRVANLLGVSAPQRVIFTCNATDSLNQAIHGLLVPGDHVITSALEHNSVLRPLHDLAERVGVQLTVLQPNAQGVLSPDQITPAIRPDTRLIALTHASNVTGIVQPVLEIGEIAKEHSIPFLVDAAQTAGVVPIQFDESPFELLACAGHKGLLGPLGTGILCLSPSMAEKLRPTRQGGTGTQSESATQPTSLPDRFESGNHNVPGIVGLDAGVDYLLDRGIEEIRQQEEQALGQLQRGLSQIEGVKLIGGDDVPKIGVVSVTSDLYDPQTLAALLSQEFGIETRAGLHCAPQTHDWLQTTATGGTLRLSVGPFTTPQEIDRTIEAFEALHRSE
ncbi:MAG: aminotransferase class V-fold PLP-dependent enzyme [Planctomycetaceae bacterium]|nr:aminotransferase class V-fold PLP-dependent enzyme [Planctomycetaceae bacterium]